MLFCKFLYINTVSFDEKGQESLLIVGIDDLLRITVFAFTVKMGQPSTAVRVAKPIIAFEKLPQALEIVIKILSFL